ncbi:Methylated-DNA--protein-cysteine methyltransferase, constitutive [Bacteroidales bacterium Barb7]|nr:Methylated-DNA--protein-cysteine methyltransferase, constitutive [Bacteroidales bacterium Barb7]
MIYNAYMQSPVGWIWLQATDTHLCRANQVAAPGKVTERDGSSPVLRNAIVQLEEYFAGKRTGFDLPLQQDGTSFQQKVWSELLRIPYGTTITYAELASRSGNPKACRAAGSANGKNNIFIIIPCHRVIQSSGKTGGYAYGTDMKQFLLDLEKAVAAE